MFSGLNEDLQDEIQIYTLYKPVLDSRPSECLGSDSSFLATSLVIARSALSIIYLSWAPRIASSKSIFYKNIQRGNRVVLHY